jgi:hypothetical protein
MKGLSQNQREEKILEVYIGSAITRDVHFVTLTQPLLPYC